MEKVINGIKIECIKGDITKQNDIVAIVNAANSKLLPGGGVSGAIHKAAGPELYKECIPLAPIKPGDAVLTGGYDLPNKYVIHCLGPVYGVDKPSDKILSNCYKNALKLAEENKIESIAFPAISTGIFGYPIKEAAEVAFKTIIKLIPDLKFVKRIRFVLYDENSFKIHKEILSRLLP
jgi:O-acetyl-ADP-ribose deacetylase (regulator of RNase III)